MQKINLIQFLPYFPPHKWWLETVAEELSYFYVQKWYGEVINVVFDVGQLETKKYQQRWYSVYLLPSFDIIPNFPVPKFWKKEFWEIFKKIIPPTPLSEGGLDDKWIVQTHTRFFLSSLLGWIFAKKHNFKWIHVEHGSDYVKLGSVLKSKIAYIYDRVIGKWIFKKADSLVAISEWVRDFIQNEFVSQENEIQVIYNGIDFHSSKKIDNWEIVKLWFVWRLVELKWVSLLLDAFKKISERHINTELLIVGDGQERSKLEQYVELNNLKNVKFLWFQDRQYIGEYFLPQIDILINPSYQEWLPTTVIEWLLSWCVVVASDVWWTKEISKKEDLIIIEKWNVESLEKWIEKAILSYKEYRWKSGYTVKNTFDWEKNIELYFSLYKNL